MILQRQDFANRGIIVDPPPQDSNELVTCDLHVGTIYHEPGRPVPVEFPKAPYVLRPNRCIVLTTKERLSVPDGVFGLLCSKGSLTARGLIVANTKVDPRFAGHLRIAVFNASDIPIKIALDAPFCSIFFQLLERPTRATDTRQAPQPPTDRRAAFARFWDGMNSQALLVAIVASVLTALLSYAFSELGRWRTLSDSKAPSTSPSGSVHTP